MKEEAEADDDWGAFGGETNDNLAKPPDVVKDDDDDWGAFGDASEEQAKADDTSTN